MQSRLIEYALVIKAFAIPELLATIEYTLLTRVNSLSTLDHLPYFLNVGVSRHSQSDGSSGHHLNKDLHFLLRLNRKTIVILLSLIRPRHRLQ